MWHTSIFSGGHFVSFREAPAGNRLSRLTAGKAGMSDYARV
jgi:hypothetical protein